MSRPAVFLDRDGTINREVDYLSDPDQFELIPGAGDALAELAQAGWALVVVTNQSGIARGMLDEETLKRIHARMETQLEETYGVRFDGIEWCPHHPDFGAQPRDCACRKPLPGMLLAAAQRLDLDRQRSWTVGDSLRDLEAGHAAGTSSILVRTGKGASQEQKAPRGTLIVDDLAAAARHILGKS